MIQIRKLAPNFFPFAALISTNCLFQDFRVNVSQCVIQKLGLELFMKWYKKVSVFFGQLPQAPILSCTGAMS